MPRCIVIAIISTALLLAACAGGDRTVRQPEAEVARAGVARAPEPVPQLPDVPLQAGPPALDLAYPFLGAARPDADSTFLFGTTGTGEATLTVNGIRVPVAPNGAFLAFLPVADRYVLEAEAAGQTDRLTFHYGQPLSAAQARALPAPRVGTVISGRDTLAAGSEIVAGRMTPGGDRHWFFPRGTRLTVTGTLPGLYRVALADSVFAWVDQAAVRLDDPIPSAPDATAPDATAPDATAPDAAASDAAASDSVGPVSVVSSPHALDVRIAVDFAPFRVVPRERSVGLTVYGRSFPTGAVDLGGDSFVDSTRWHTPAADSVHLAIRLAAPLWGVKAFYDDAGRLVLRLRRPPHVDPAAPLQGLRVCVDPGHPPGGAVGPTGLTEAEANLAIARRLADRLRARGAEIVMTRTGAAPLENASWAPDELWARVDLAVASGADLLVSIHNNAFPDGTNPFDRVGSETYYFHPFAQPLAEALADEIAATTGLPNKGARRRSLALVRPTWLPAVLTESLYMMFPQQEAALKDPAFLDRLAEAHLRGIEQFVRTHGAAP